MHSAPDPLLHVLWAANFFGIMVGIKMIANADSDDCDVSIGDIMEEERILEEWAQALRPESWADLAKGLGLPNGYYPSLGEVTASR
jgi:hypothetical protein